MLDTDNVGYFKDLPKDLIGIQLVMFQEQEICEPAREQHSGVKRRTIIGEMKYKIIQR